MSISWGQAASMGLEELGRMDAEAAADARSEIVSWADNGQQLGDIAHQFRAGPRGVHIDVAANRAPNRKVTVVDVRFG